MSASSFWDNILEPGENLLWAGRPKPRLHWRNWRLYGPAPMAILGLGTALFLARVTVGPDPTLWLFAIAGLLALIPLRTTRRQLAAYAATRYALTDRRAIYFRIENGQTRVKAYPKDVMTAPVIASTLPQSVNFISYSLDKNHIFGFEYIDNHATLADHLTRII